MGTTNINFKNNDVECYSLGRNGYIKTKGIAYTHNGDIVTIEPIRANGQIGRCSIQIPFEDLLDFVKTIVPCADQDDEVQEEIEAKDVAIGDTIEIEGKTYKCVKNCETEICDNCDLFSMRNGCDYVLCRDLRADETDVHFELVDTEEACAEKAENGENASKESTQIKVGEVGFLGGEKVRYKQSSEQKHIDIKACAYKLLMECASDDYAHRILDVIETDIIDDVDECADPVDWNDDDVRLAIGRALVNKLENNYNSTNDAVEQEERNDYTNPIIGHVYEINGTKCICKAEEDDSSLDCCNCCFEDTKWEDVCQHIKCSATCRSDNKSIYFEAVE